VHTVAMPPSGRARTVVYLQDLRPIRELERRLAEAQRLRESATLAAGLAHDFNNVLAVVVTNARLLSRLVETEGKELLDEIRSAADSGQSIAKEMLAFSRSQQSAQTSTACDLSEAVESCVRLVSKLAGSDIEVATTLTDDPLLIDLAAGNVQQIVFNLVTNARDAIEGGGTITLVTRREVGHAVLEVTDTGSGMSEEQVARVFQPFFTTKPRGVGTGLGLFVIAGLVQGVGGDVSVSSQRDRGTVFTLRFPLSAFKRPAHPTPPPVATPRHSLKIATVLLVEDRVDLRRAITRLLRHAGYRVLVAASGQEALALANEHRPSVVLSDYDMPGMDGLTLRDRLHERIEVPFILMSGLALDRKIDTVMLQKPVDPDRLLAVIAEHIVGPPSSPPDAGG